LRIADQVLGDVLPWDRDGFAPQLLGQPQRLGHSVAVGVREAVMAWGFDVKGQPLGVAAVGHASGSADQAWRVRTGADAHQNTLPGWPRTRDGVRLHIGLHLLVHPFRRPTEGKLPQCRQVAQTEKTLNRSLCLFGDIDLALTQALQQLIRRQVNQLDLGGAIEDPVGNGLPHARASDLRDGIIQTFQMLDIDRGIHVNASGE
jgi:hypothetical protein